MCNVHGRWGAKGWSMYGCVGCGPAQAKAAKYATTTQPSVHDYTEHTPLHTPQQTVQDTCASPRIPARARGFTHTPARPICMPTHSTLPHTPAHRAAHNPPWKRRMAHTWTQSTHTLAQTPYHPPTLEEAHGLLDAMQTAQHGGKAAHALPGHVLVQHDVRRFARCAMPSASGGEPGKGALQVRHAWV